MAKATVKKIGRKRRAAGWTLLTLGVLVAGVWGASGRNTFDWRSSDEGLSIRQGHFVVNWNWTAGSPDGRPLGWSTQQIGPSAQGLRWTIPDRERVPQLQARFPGTSAIVTWFAVYLQIPTIGEGLGFVLWPIPLLLWTPAALLLRSGIVARRRALTGKCKTCGYDLAGLPPTGIKCPECGKAKTD